MTLGTSGRQSVRNDRLGKHDVIELVRTNDLVAISLIESLLRQEKIGFFVADQHMSVLEGSIGILPRRILVETEREHAARRLLKDAGLETHLKNHERNG